jgi:hypothetical protein
VSIAYTHTAPGRAPGEEEEERERERGGGGQTSHPRPVLPVKVPHFLFKVAHFLLQSGNIPFIAI